MRKLRLDAEHLEVMSFEISEGTAREEGTVAGHGNVPAATEAQDSCGYLPSCKAILTCRPSHYPCTVHTCDYTCAACGSEYYTYCYCEV